MCYIAFCISILCIFIKDVIYNGFYIYIYNLTFLYNPCVTII